LKKLLGALLPQFVFNYLKRQHQRNQFHKWQKNGQPLPPPHLVKQLAIRDYQQRYAIKTLVETGTYRGDMVEAQKRNFEKIISIELGVDLTKKATSRFKHDKNVLIVQGDSGKVLPRIMPTIESPAIFWLDGHYSAGITAKGEKDCPIFAELDAIFHGMKLDHVLLIDDARCFNGEGDYPEIDELTQYINVKNKNYRLEDKDDIIRYTVEGR
jgi:hypothetical protein